MLARPVLIAAAASVAILVRGNSTFADQLDFLGMTGGGVAVTAHHLDASGSAAQSTATFAGRVEWLDVDTRSNLVTHSIELTQFVPRGAGEYALVPLLGLPEGSRSSLGLGLAQLGRLAELFENHGEQALAFADAENAVDLTEAAALQMAVWELIHERTESAESASLTAGNAWFEARSGTHAGLFAASLSLAQDWLRELDGAFDRAWLGRLRGLTSDGHQDQIMVVPLPAPAALAGFGLLLVTMGRRNSRPLWFLR